MINFPIQNVDRVLNVHYVDLHSLLVVLSLVSLSDFLPVSDAETSDVSVAWTFGKLFGVTRSRSNAFGNASPSRSVLEQTLSWSSQPSTEPTPSSGNVSSYLKSDRLIISERMKI